MAQSLNGEESLKKFSGLYKKKKSPKLSVVIVVLGRSPKNTKKKFRTIA